MAIVEELTANSFGLRDLHVKLTLSEQTEQTWTINLFMSTAVLRVSPLHELKIAVNTRKKARGLLFTALAPPAGTRYGGKFLAPVSCVHTDRICARRWTTAD